MVLTTDDTLEAILAETVAAAETALRDMKGEAAPPPPPPPAPSLRPWCGACELTGDGLRVAAVRPRVHPTGRKINVLAQSLPTPRNYKSY